MPSLNDKDKWKWQRAGLSAEQVEKIRKIDGNALPDEIWINDLYEVWRRDNVQQIEGFPAVIWLSIKRRTREIVRDWRHLQRIKNEIVGPEHEAVELFPAESRLVDGANQYHLFVLKEAGLRFPFGFQERLVHDGASQFGERQRKFEPSIP